MVRTARSQHPSGCLLEPQLLVPAPDLHSPTLGETDPAIHLLNKPFCGPLFLLIIGALISGLIMI